jgi:hypothetical protein
MATVYPKPKSRFSWFDRHDVIPLAVAEDVYEGEIVGRVTANGNIVAYNPAASDGSENPIGVVVYADAASGNLANIAFRGTFGDVFAAVKTTDTFSGDGATTEFTLSRGAVKVLSVKVGGVEVTDYEVDGTTLTFGTAPASGVDNVEVVYLGKPDSTDFWKLAPNILIETVTEY